MLAKTLQPIGILDIGSNSIRFVVFEPPYIGERPVFNEKVQCGLGRDLAAQNRLCKKGMKCAIDSLLGFKSLAQAMVIKNLHIVGTAALRDAKDGRAFAKTIREKTGLKINIIDGQKEAYYAALGVMTFFPDAKGVVGDLGGGSLELARIDNKMVTSQSSYALGTLRIMGQKQKKQYINDQLAKISGELRQEKLFYAVGGTWRMLAGLHMADKGKAGYALRGYKIAAKDMIEFAEKIAEKDQDTLVKKYHVEKGRAELLPYSALLLAKLLQRLNSKTVIISDTSLREGVLFEAVQDMRLKKSA
jgi:exopolyphosphatase/guanosine-5'-triphosphate,3'-diphosphate pyrophosphatase